MASFNRTMRRALERGKKPEKVKYSANFDETRRAMYERPQIYLDKISMTPWGVRKKEIR